MFATNGQYNYQIKSQQMSLKTLTIMLLLSIHILSQQPSKAEEVSQRENSIRTQNKMTYTNIKSHTFVCGRFDDFVLMSSVSSQIQFQLHNYWKQVNVYVSAQYREGEEVRVIVYQDNQRVLLDREYYITTGFSFQANKGSNYTVRFLAAGRVTKLVSMIHSSPIQVSGDIATKDHIDSAQQKVQKIGNELKALLIIQQRSFLMKQKIGSKVLSNTKIYMGYQIFQVVLIISVAIIQVVSLTKLLKGGSLV